jgi:hypothetical protein
VLLRAGPTVPQRRQARRRRIIQQDQAEHSAVTERGVEIPAAVMERPSTASGVTTAAGADEPSPGMPTTVYFRVGGTAPARLSTNPVSKESVHAAVSQNADPGRRA